MVSVGVTRELLVAPSKFLGLFQSTPQRVIMSQTDLNLFMQIAPNTQQDSTHIPRFPNPGESNDSKTTSESMSPEDKPDARDYWPEGDHSNPHSRKQANPHYGGVIIHFEAYANVSGQEAESYGNATGVSSQANHATGAIQVVANTLFGVAIIGAAALRWFKKE
ncbi:uncharacterized protein F4807DRAFT_468331 [Annulohypoxylon truncatum]|uniref:uncharacterized protein n=1 Tax=Annulohypoxylon truncatum TaxID=327061 RepID=UPI002007D584|nr:uncharacterized protein F4807DRAFT_468331 [Annulohypoxylon truncatum]KAI1214447.1 hypothetical protein F4807DRAFT_468331 [Annulohypoxylon truncatum]